MDNKRNALHNFLATRGITVENFFNKKLMLNKDNEPIPLTLLNLILTNLTIKISKENFDRIAKAYDLTVIENSNLSKMIVKPWRIVRRSKSSNDLLAERNIATKQIIKL